MQVRFLMAASAALALAACGGSGGSTEATDAAEAEANAAGNLAAPDASAAARAGATAANGQQFVELAGGGDLFEIESAAIALEKTQNAAIRELAGMIRTDHERATRELRGAAGEAQPPINVAPRMTPEQQMNLDRLRNADAAAFDQEYLQQQIQAHEQALTLVTSYAATGDVPSLQRHASTVAGPIQQHLSRARELSEPAAQPPQ
jgi:putative membrane protein